VLQPFFTSQNMIVNTVWSVSIKFMFHMVFSLKLAYILQFRYCLFFVFKSKLDVFEKNACLPPRVPPCALLKEGKERDMTFLKRKRLLR